MKAAISFITQNLTKGLFSAIVIFIAAYGVGAQRTTAVAKGEWGGSEVAMTVTETGATIQFDCANANITKQLRVKKDGSFVAERTFTRNGPGPVRIDAQATLVAIKGKLAGKALTLHITDAKTRESLGDFTVRQGESVRLHRCY